MDWIFISKLTMILGSYALTLFVYKSIDWNARGLTNWKSTFANNLNDFLSRVFKKNLDDVRMFVVILFFAMPAFAAVVLVGYLILFEGTLKFLDSKSYWEQVFYSFAIICLFFCVRIYLDSEKFKIAEKDKEIKELRNQIWKLEKKRHDQS